MNSKEDHCFRVGQFLFGLAFALTFLYEVDLVLIFDFFFLIFDFFFDFFPLDSSVVVACGSQTNVSGGWLKDKMLLALNIKAVDSGNTTLQESEVNIWQNWESSSWNWESFSWNWQNWESLCWKLTTDKTGSKIEKINHKNFPHRNPNQAVLSRGNF